MGSLISLTVGLRHTKYEIGLSYCRGMWSFDERSRMEWCSGVRSLGWIRRRGMSFTVMPNSRNWSGQMRLCSIRGKNNDCGKNNTNVVNDIGQSYATAAVTTRTFWISFISGWKPATDTECVVSETIKAFLPNAHVSAWLSSSHRTSDG